MLDFTRLLVLSCTLTLQIHGVQAACYYPNGDVATTDQTCDASKLTSHCCGAGYACLSNGLCTKTDLTADRAGDTYGRGSCTDRSWGSGCPNYCVDPKVDIMNGGTGMGRCLDGVGINKFFCMNKNKASVDCAAGKGVYTLGNPSVLTTIGVKGSSSTVVGALKLSTSSSISTTSSVTSATQTPSTFTTVTTTTEPNPIPTAAINTTPTPTDTSPPNTNPPTSNTTAIGAGVGVGAGIVLLGIIAALLFYIRRRKKQDPRGELRYSHPPPFYQPAEMPHYGLGQKERDGNGNVNGDGRTYELL